MDDRIDNTAHDTTKTCPQCGEVLSTLLFLGVFPDGYVCTTCNLYYDDDLKPLARLA